MEHDGLLANEWFQNNKMKLNQDKCHLLVSGYKHGIGFKSLRDYQIS